MSTNGASPDNEWIRRIFMKAFHLVIKTSGTSAPSIARLMLGIVMFSCRWS